MDKKSPLFNHEKAMLITNNDESIVLKLRHLFVQDLPIQLHKTELLFQNENIDELQNQLHHILGGAQVCAAECLSDLIMALKNNLTNTIGIDKLSEQLWQQIKMLNTLMQDHVCEQ